MSEIEYSSSSSSSPSFLSSLIRSLHRKWRVFLDRSVPHLAARWFSLLLLTVIYAVRVYSLAGFYIITYGLGIFELNLLIGFISPLESDDGDIDGPILPVNNSDEFKPFIRRLPEFQFWYASFRAVSVSLFLTLFSVFDVPVFWPILLVYFILLFFVTMKRQIKHMMKHHYLPFDLGKKKYKGKTHQQQQQQQQQQQNNIGAGAGAGAGAGVGPSSAQANSLAPHAPSTVHQRVAEDIRSR